ncbi:hypothetical protein BST61_g9979 [Cercospora zeina]
MQQHRSAEHSEDENQIQYANAAKTSEQPAVSPAFAYHPLEATTSQARYARDEAEYDVLEYIPPSTTRPHIQSSADYAQDLPALLRPAYGKLSRSRSPSDDFMAAEVADQTNMMRMKQDRIDCWIDTLESQLSIARTQTTSLDEVPLNEHLPPLPRTASGQPRNWKGQQRKAVPVPSMHGSILIATSGPSGEQSRTVSSRRTVPSRRNRLMQPDGRGGDVVVESPWRSSEVLLLATLCLFQALMYYPYGQGLTTAASISSSLLHGTERSAQELPGDDHTKVIADAAWIAASYPLTHAVFSLLGHQIGTACGHRLVLLAACVFWAAFQLGCAFAPSVAVLCILRAFSGMGAAFITSSVSALVVVCMPAGRKRATTIGLMGAMALLGTSAACVLSALFVQLTAWKWSFIAPASCGVTLLILALVTVPQESAWQSRAKIDVIGSYLGIAGFCLLNFVFNQARVVGWDDPYIYILIPIALGHTLSFFFWETRIASEPVLPVALWRSRHLPRTLFMTLCSCLSLGVFLWYFSLFGAQIRKYSPVENGANYQPITALSIATISAAFQLLTWASAKSVLAGVNLALVVANTLLAAAPGDLTFWGMMFPAVCIVALSATLVPVAGRAMDVENLGQQHQSIAVTLLYAALSYGLSMGIGVAGTVETIARGDSDDVRVGYQCAFIFAVAPAGIALVGSLLFLGGDARSKTGGFERMKESNKLPRRLLTRADRPGERGFVVERRQPTIIVSS